MAGRSELWHIDTARRRGPARAATALNAACTTFADQVLCSRLC
jgi:hypothetical protein